MAERKPPEMPQGVDRCFHGGQFFTAVGPDFEHLERAKEIVNADVLDAWFPPAPLVVETLRAHLPWLLQTSPPTHCEGMVAAIAQARGVPEANLLPGSGSSDLMFLALTRWLAEGARVLVLDPTYGEYVHILAHLLRCRVDRFICGPAQGYAIDPDSLAERLQGGGYDLCVLVNPNSPTGLHLDRGRLTEVLAAAPGRTRFWIDETYVEYAGPGQSLESFACASENVVVCKSMSKCYALSGARVAYLCGPERLLAELRRFTPPWVVSLPGQVACVMALKSPDYYARCYAQTHVLRQGLREALLRLPGIAAVLDSTTNFLLCFLRAGAPSSAQVVALAAREGVFLRDASSMALTRVDLPDPFGPVTRTPPSRLSATSGRTTDLTVLNLLAPRLRAASSTVTDAYGNPCPLAPTTLMLSATMLVAVM